MFLYGLKVGYDTPNHVTAPTTNAVGFQGSECSRTPRQRRQPSSQYIQCGVVVPRRRESTLGTLVDSDRKVLRDHLVTLTANLTRILGIHFHEHPASIFRFVGCVCQELTPRNIGDAAVHRSEIALHHALDLQILDADDAEFVHQLATQLVGEVLATIRDFLPHFPEGPLFLVRLSEPLGLSECCR